MSLAVSAKRAPSACAFSRGEKYGGSYSGGYILFAAGARPHPANPNFAATEREIRDFAATRLADFKVPRKVLVMDEIPKGATGKLQRIGLAAKLGLAG